MALNKEIWLADLMENLIPDDSWLTSLRDLSAFVDDHKLHIGEAGAMPSVIKDNTSWPLDTDDVRADTDNEKTLAVYDTSNQILRNAEKVELAYDKRASIILNHRNALVREIAKIGAHKIIPNVNGTNKILLPTTGASYTDGISKKRATFADLLDMQKAMDELLLPRDGRVAVLSPQHLADLMLSDLALYKQIISSGKVFDFKLYRYADVPYYVASGSGVVGAKVALSTTYAAASHGKASFFFHKDEAFKAIGTAGMYAVEKSPAERGDVIGFQLRALIDTMRGAYINVGGLATVKA